MLTTTLLSFAFNWMLTQLPIPADDACEVTICCDHCQGIGDNGLNACRGCEAAGDDGCETGQTELDCAPGTCYQGLAKLNYSTAGNNACE